MVKIACLVVVVNVVKMQGLVIGIKNMTLTNLVVVVNVLALFFLMAG